MTAATQQPTARDEHGERAPEREIEIAIVGSGMSGLAMGHYLRRAGIEDFTILERADRVGGTWRDNIYPGCACDIPSHVYSFSFAPNPGWSATFSPQAEIQAYIERVARERGLIEHVRFGCDVRAADWDEDAQRWRLQTSLGPIGARVLIAAAGPLSEPKVPDIPGLDGFAGAVFHTARWDAEHDLTGERVAVIGTGASAIQVVPSIQPRVARLDVYQRTPPWVLPHPGRPLSAAEHAVYERFPAAQRAVREAIALARESFALPMLHVALSPIITRIGRRHLRRQVSDPQLRARLTPSYAAGCKRILPSNDYLPALQQPNVELVDSGIAELRGHSIVASDGTEREVDTIILATGFHVTDMPIAALIRGRGGRSLDDVWQGSPQALRGTTVAGFPNAFLLLGPNTGLGHNSVMLIAEWQARYAAQAIAQMRARGVGAIEPRADAQRAFNERLQRRMRGTVWTAGGCKSWYIDRNGRNSTLWPDFAYGFKRALARFDPSEYELSPAPAVVPAAA